MKQPEGWDMLETPDIVALLSLHLDHDEQQALAAAYRLYQLSFEVLWWARLVFFLFLAPFILSLFHVSWMPRIIGAYSGLLTGSSLLLFLLIQPSFDKAFGALQEMSDRALIRARIHPVDLLTGKPKR